MYTQEAESSSSPTWHLDFEDLAQKHPRTGGRMFGIRFFLSSLLAILLTLPPSSATPVVSSSSLSQAPSLTSRAAGNSSLLECLQVAAPVYSPVGGCQQTLMVHTFAYSYGDPFIGDYSPPDCHFNRVVFNLTVTSAGRQFDRLALMYFNDIEIFRTSTAEPTKSGIIWSYSKDMTAFLALFRTPQKIIFDLGNIVDDTYTGLWDTTLTATFFAADDAIDPADVVLPISAQRSAANQTSAFIVPEVKAANNLTLPQNVRKAVFSISACGQATEEFWWSNVLNSDSNVFGNDTTLYGHSPFRELQLLIDGRLAGVAWPFPVIFTGGIVPGFWRPVVGIDAFDLREDEIDISPFIPLISDGKQHTFEIRVIGIDDDGKGHGEFTEAIGSNWVVTGKLFIWLNGEKNTTVGSIRTVHAPEPDLRLYSSTRKSPNGTVDVVDYSIQVSRSLYIESVINTSSGPKVVFWKQKLTYSNSGSLSNQGNDQIVRQSTTGSSASISGFNRIFQYPLWVGSSYNVLDDGNFSITGEMGRGKNVKQTSDLAFPNDWKTFDYSRLPSQSQHLSFLGSDVNNWQTGTASYFGVPAQKKSYGSGNTEQIFALSGIIGPHSTIGAGAWKQPSKELYRRHIIAANNSVVYNNEIYGGEKVGGQGRMHFTSQSTSGEGAQQEFAGSGVRALLGRGPY